MLQAHLQALKRKHDDLERLIHDESIHAARDEMSIRRMKKQKLHVHEEMERMSRKTG